MTLLRIALATGVVISAAGSLRAQDAAIPLDPINTEYELERAAIEACAQLTESIRKMFVALDEPNLGRRREALKVFRTFRLTASQYRLYAGVYRTAGLLVAPVDANELERTVDVFGLLFYAPYGHCPKGNQFDPAWFEFLGYFEHANSRVRALAFAHAARSYMVVDEISDATLRGCRDPVAAVRGEAFRFLARVLRYTSRRDPNFAAARDCVVKALDADREVARDGLYDCARELGEQASASADELLKGMQDDAEPSDWQRRHGQDARTSAAWALARVAPTTATVERIAAEMRRGDLEFRRAALTFFAAFPDGPTCPPLVAVLAEMLAAKEPSERFAAVKIVLGDDFTTLHNQGLVAAEKLMHGYEFHFHNTHDIAKAIARLGRTHDGGRALVRRLLRDPDLDVRWPMIDSIAHLPGYNAEAYFWDLAFQSIFGHCDDVRHGARDGLRLVWDQLRIEPLRLFVSR